MSNEVTVSAEEPKGEEKGPEKKGSKKKDVGKVVKKISKVFAGADNDVNDILEWLHEGTEVLFDKGDLPKLKDEELERLPYGTVKSYKKEQREAERQALSGISDIETLSGNASTKLTLRERRGWHQTWKRPDEFEDAKRKGYVEIREPKKEGEKPGQETGPVIKIYKEQGVIELIAMEVSQERYDRHVELISKKSRDAYKGNKAGFAETVEEVNSRVGKESRVKLIDDEGDIG